MKTLTAWLNKKMPLEPLLTPSLATSSSEKLDWLEFTAFLSSSGVARLDVLVSALDQQEEEQTEDFGEEDRQKEAIVAELENEFDYRSQALGEEYPFLLSDDAEELHLVRSWEDQRAVFYFVCLLSSHLVNSPFVTFDISTGMITRLRNEVFQIVSTLAMAGVSLGPSVSIGWPRNSDETILEVLRRASAGHAGFNARAAAHPEVANPHDKDGGMDVISWRSAYRPPPLNLYFGQVASGADWKGKSAANKAKSFKAKFIELGPLGNEDYTTLTPLRIADEPLWKREHADHGSIVDRTMLPTLAYSGMQLAADGVMVDEAENLPTVLQWVADYRTEALS
ncbi:hypothetical protein [Litoreibacter roseus]|uniref:hypothetical protein n=1 Tax=Litoreibacter roseus TaxID=2601869 RepID=UPI0013586BDB|nr:hypothetical protein [Litoreibacter roseus]